MGAKFQLLLGRFQHLQHRRILAPKLLQCKKFTVGAAGLFVLTVSTDRSHSVSGGKVTAVCIMGVAFAGALARDLPGRRGSRGGIWGLLAS